MATRDKYAPVDSDAIRRARLAKGWNQERLAEAAGVSVGVVKGLEAGRGVQPQNIPKIAEPLGLDPKSILKPIHHEQGLLTAGGSYTWNDLVNGAEVVANLAFRKFGVDVILTFPSTSLVFAGLVLAAVPAGDAVRTEVDTVILAEGNVRTPPKGFRRVFTGNYTMFVPEAVIRDKSRKIVVVDDHITSGGAMEALRHFFLENYEPANVRFASCICYDGLKVRTGPGVKMPDFIGIKPNASEITFGMPWNKNSVTFEEALREPRTLRGSEQRARAKSKEPAE